LPFDWRTGAGGGHRNPQCAARYSGATFITPFDRSDIRNLISRMDDTIDQMNKSAQAIVAFDLTSFAPEMRELGGLIIEAAQLVRKTVPLLSNCPGLRKRATRSTRADHLV
jgi:uncharacterized protein Yka (UPF0111/DUF47 family)